MRWTRPKLERLSAEVGFPALLKPRDGTACRGIHLVEDAAQLAGILEATDHPSQMILEERMEDLSAAGPYADRLSIETIACNGAFGHLGITGLFRMMPLFRSTGGFFPADVSPSFQRELFELTTTAIRALGSDFGFYRTEIKLTPDGPRIIEINGRPTGLTPTVVKLASGVPLLQLAMRLALGEDVAVDGPVPCAADRLPLLPRAPDVGDEGAGDLRPVGAGRAARCPQRRRPEGSRRQPRLAEWLARQDLSGDGHRGELRGARPAP